MKVVVSRWGNSLALRLPKAIASTHHLAEGSAVEIAETSKGILLTPAKQEPDLESMLSQITRSNLHASVDTAETQGKELW